MREVVIVDGVRTPIARAHKEKGWFRNTRPDDLAVACVKALLERTKVDPEQIEELVFGCANMNGPQAACPARMIALLSGLPADIAALSTDRQCASAMSAAHYATLAIKEGMGDIMIIGGLESMSMVPMGQGIEFNGKLGERYPLHELPMGPTAEKVAKLFNISREDMDQFAYECHMKAAAAQEAGRFKDEIIPIEVTYEDGTTATIDRDQCVRADTTLEKLATLMPSFDMEGAVTAGNSSPLNDGACAMMLMTKEKARELGLTPLATIRHMTVAGVDPTIMGIGPVPAVNKLLDRAGMTIDQFDLIEINEAFASQSLYCIRELGMPAEKVNVNGGALALGHPLGESGARIMITLVHEMKRRNSKWGLATLCVGFGQGAATSVERESY